MGKKKNSGYLKNFERNSGIGRNEKNKNKIKLHCKKSDESQGIQTEKAWQCSSIKSTTYSLYSRERCTEQSFAVRAREGREKEERERGESTTIPGPNRDRPQLPF
jgi:hypothetical protein